MAMAERGMIFGAWSIRRILDEIERPGTGKRMTRRVLKPQPDYRGGYGCECDYEEWGWEDQDGDHISVLDIAPNGYRPGDLAYAREAWRTLAIYDHLPPRDLPDDAPIWYEADGPAPEGFGRYRSAMHMPRNRSRITQRVTGVRVERLLDISEDDARAEGIRGNASGPWGCEGLIEDFADLWEQIHGPGSWDANPWVAVIEMAPEK